MNAITSIMTGCLSGVTLGHLSFLGTRFMSNSQDHELGVLGLTALASGGVAFAKGHYLGAVVAIPVSLCSLISTVSYNDYSAHQHLKIPAIIATVCTALLGLAANHFFSLSVYSTILLTATCKALLDCFLARKIISSDQG